MFFEGFEWKKLMAKAMDTFYKPSIDVQVKPGEIEKALAKEKNKAQIRFLADKANK
jgi:hypothetical protein